MPDLDDGGPAFPGEQGHIPDGTWNQTWDPGMSLRDWFAGQALASLDREAVSAAARATGRGAMECAAQLAYDFADAMLAERAREEAGNG